jgi:hypothetical protein
MRAARAAAAGDTPGGSCPLAAAGAVAAAGATVPAGLGGASGTTGWVEGLGAGAAPERNTAGALAAATVLRGRAGPAQLPRDGVLSPGSCSSPCCPSPCCPWLPARLMLEPPFTSASAAVARCGAIWSAARAVKL